MTSSAAGSSTARPGSAASSCDARRRVSRRRRERGQGRIAWSVRAAGCWTCTLEVHLTGWPRCGPGSCACSGSSGAPRACAPVPVQAGRNTFRLALYDPASRETGCAGLRRGTPHARPPVPRAGQRARAWALTLSTSALREKSCVGLTPWCSGRGRPQAVASSRAAASPLPCLQ
jgi:hypothetical protein